METKKVFAFISLALLVGFSFGRFALPPKTVVKVEEKTVEKIVEVQKKSKQNDKVVTVIEKTNPDGSKTKETTVVDKSRTDTDKQLGKETISDKKSFASKGQGYPEWFVSASAGKNFGGSTTFLAPFSFGLSVSRRFLGPIYLGADVTNEKYVGGRIGLGF